MLASCHRDLRLANVLLHHLVDHEHLWNQWPLIHMACPQNNWPCHYYSLHDYASVLWFCSNLAESSHNPSVPLVIHREYFIHLIIHSHLNCLNCYFHFQFRFLFQSLVLWQFVDRKRCSTFLAHEFHIVSSNICILQDLYILLDFIGIFQFVNCWLFAHLTS